MASTGYSRLSTDRSRATAEDVLGPDTNTAYTGVDPHGTSFASRGHSSVSRFRAIQQSQRNIRQALRLNSPWRSEIFWWLIATAYLLMIAIILSVFHDQALDNFNSELGIDTIVSTLSNFEQMALMVPLAGCISQLKWRWFLVKRASDPQHHSEFGRAVIDLERFDRSSRGGPLDNLVLFLRVRIFEVVSIGTVIFFLLPTLSPTAVESVKITNSRPKSVSQSNIARSVDYNTYPGITGSDQIFSKTGGSETYDSVASSMKAAILQGLYTRDANLSDVQANCPTGTCDWSPYTSLAVCSSMEDTTPQITKKCRKEDEPELRKGCNYTVSVLANHPPWPNAEMEASHSQILFIGASNPNKASKQPPSQSNTLVDFYVIYYFDRENLHKEDFNYTEQLRAFKGTLGLCLQTWNTSTVNGATVTTELDRHTSLNWQLQEKHNETTLFQAVTATLSDEAFSMSESTRYMMQVYLSTATFTGTASQIDSSNTYFDSDAAHALASAIYEAPGGAEDGFRTLLRNTAISMTNSLRTSSETPSSVPGTATVPEFYITVNFVWLIPAIALDALTLLFLLVVIFTQPRDMPVWTSSQMAVLRALEVKTRNHMGGLGAVDMMEVEGEGIVVRLEDNDGRWQLGEVERELQERSNAV